MDSKAIFNLRNEAKELSGYEKLSKLDDALKIANNLYLTEPYDEWNQKAIAWVLIDLCKYHISDRNLNQAETFFNGLNSIDFQGYEDEIIENQKSYLRPKIDINYSEVRKAEELSKNGNSQEALSIFKKLISQNRLNKLHHESYGWVIYRYIKAEEDSLSSVQVRRFLRDYMNLENERPSMVHSMILNFALNYSKAHKDFKFYTFFLMWNPSNLRYEDLHDATSSNDNHIPSLISRICREFVNTNNNVNVEEFLRKINLDRETVLDFFRKAFFWNIFNAHKEDQHSKLWNLFDEYNNDYSKFGQSKWHSEILNLAERLMKGNDEWRFLGFFKDWNPENLRNDDWRETTLKKNTYKPLAIGAIKKAFDILKTQTSEKDLFWLIQPYEKAINFFPNNEWLLREKALLHFKNNELEVALTIYKQLVLEIAGKHYVWHEFSNCINFNNSVKIGMLSKALSLEKNEDFLGEIHLNLAKTLVNEGLLENAIVELEAYKKHRESKGWKLSSLFNKLQQKVNLIESNIEDNQQIYDEYIPFAEDFAYSDLDWTNVVLVEKWEDSNNQKRLKFTDGRTIEFVIKKNRFDVLKKSELGEVFKFKLYKQKIKREVEAELILSLDETDVPEYKYVPLMTTKTEKEYWSILDDTIAVVDYINKEKNIVHTITTEDKEVFFPQIKSELQIGDFIAAKSYTKKIKGKNRTELSLIHKIDKNFAISKFQNQIAIVDGVNYEKQLFHFVISSKMHGIVRYIETDLRPNEGDFLKLVYAVKKDRKNNIRVKVLDLEITEDTDPKLRKDITGWLELKYKNFNHEQDFPDFAFVNDFYVPKYLLDKHNITADCEVNAKVIFGGDKWKVTEVRPQNNV